MNGNTFAVGLAVGCALAGGNMMGATVVGILNHGLSEPAVILLAISITFYVCAFLSGRDALRGNR